MVAISNNFLQIVDFSLGLNPQLVPKESRVGESTDSGLLAGKQKGSKLVANLFSTSGRMLLEQIASFL